MRVGGILWGRRCEGAPTLSLH